MLIGVISDTHGFFHPAVPEYFTDVELILHAGDLGSTEILTQLQEIAPTRAVFGNIDDGDVRRLLPEHQRFDVEGVHIWMTHIGGRPGRYSPSVRDELDRAPPDIFICGHSHILRVERDEKLGGMLFINPGAAGRQGLHQVKTCLRLELGRQGPMRADVIHLDE